MKNDFQTVVMRTNCTSETDMKNDSHNVWMRTDQVLVAVCLVLAVAWLVLLNSGRPSPAARVVQPIEPPSRSLPRHSGRVIDPMRVSDGGGDLRARWMVRGVEESEWGSAPIRTACSLHQGATGRDLLLAIPPDTVADGIALRAVGDVLEIAFQTPRHLVVQRVHVPGADQARITQSLTNGLLRISIGE